MLSLKNLNKNMKNNYNIKKNKYGFFQIDPTPTPEEIKMFYAEHFYSENYKFFNDSSFEVQSSEKEFFDIKVLAETTNFSQTKKIGMILDRQNKARNAYLNKIVSFVDLQKLKPLKIVFNSGNGTAGPTLDMLKKLLVKKNKDPVINKNFPS